MGMFGAGNNNKLIGVDIGESAVKLVQLARSGKSYTVQNVAIEPVHRSLFVEGQVLDAEQVGALIKQSLREHKINAKEAVACVNFSEVISKRMMVRSDLRDRELEQWIEFEVDKFVPFPVADLNIDYHFVEAKADGPEREIQVVACRRQTVEHISSCVEHAGLTPVAIDVAHNALERASRPVVQSMSGGGVNDLTAIVDIGMSSSRFYVFAGDNMVYQREEPFGGGTLVANAASEYSMSEDKAHQAIYQKKLPSSYTENVLKPYIKLMLKEIERGLLSFEASGVDGQISRILLAGGSSRVGGLDKIVHKRIRVDVRALDPLSLFKVGRKLDSEELRSQAPQLALACGLAMWEQD